MSGISFPAPTSKWEGTTSEADWWHVEVEADSFTEDDPMVVSLDVANKIPDETDEAALAFLSPEQARELARALAFWADYVEYRNKGGRP